MPLTCNCNFDDIEDAAWFYYVPNNYSKLKARRRKRCSSCNELVDINSTIANFKCYRHPKYEIEISMYGEDGEVPIADKILCEECADIYFSLYELGFNCVSPDENMHKLIEKYKEMRG